MLVGPGMGGNVDSVNVDFSEIKPKFTRPELLQHPNIPRALAGVNPRTIMGPDQWDEHRRQVYGVNNYHCFACGINSTDAPVHQWLEGHECYDYLWDDRVLKYRETVALCHSCHNFVHCGRLYNVYLDGGVSKDILESILLHGFRILHRAGLEPDQKAVRVASYLRGEASEYLQRHEMVASMASVLHVVVLLDVGWRLLYNGVYYDELGMAS